MQDPYRTLGVERGADGDAIRKAYRRLAKEWHPDLNKSAGAEARFKEVNTAYEILGDAEKRGLWDEFGEASTRPGFDPAMARRGFRGGPAGAGGVGGIDIEELLSSMFGGRDAPGARYERHTRGQDQQLELTVDFMTTVLGGERVISIRRPDGSTDRLRVPIPAGARDGGKVRLRGQGLPPRGGGPCGDLLVVLRVLEHPVLKREEDNLEMEVPLTVLEGLQGGAVTVPTPTGDVKVTIPARVRGGMRLRLRGRGVQKRDNPGDLYLVLRPMLPDTDDAEVIAAAERMEEAYGGTIRSSLRL